MVRPPPLCHIHGEKVVFYFNSLTTRNEKHKLNYSLVCKLRLENNTPNSPIYHLA